MRAITAKKVQIVSECVCGKCSVEQDIFTIRWKDLRHSSIKRRKDRNTGKPFLIINYYSDICGCYSAYD